MDLDLKLYNDSTPDGLLKDADGLDAAAAEHERAARAKAEDWVRRALGNANKMRSQARDYRQIAAWLRSVQRSATCRNCEQPIWMQDALGWQHTGETACPKAEPVPVEPPVPGDVAVANGGVYPPPTLPVPQVDRDGPETLVQPLVPPPGGEQVTS